MISPSQVPLLTDLYELTMAQSYFHEKKFEPASFSLFIRSYPHHRSYFVAAGLEDTLRFLQDFRFDGEAVEFLHSTNLFTDDFLDYLQSLRFSGEVWAIPEGRLFFKDEPVLEITAPIIEAQIVETFVINQINFQSLIATKAARCVHAARGRAVVDFALRRTHGTDAGMKVSRSSYIAGFSGTSNVLAGKDYGIPMVGTMAHSYVLSFENEIDAFRSFAASFPDNSVLLIDTYDNRAGAQKAAVVAKEMAKRGHRLRGVRIDSGDLASISREVRRILNRAGLPEVKITASGGLDEFDLEELSNCQAPCDSYGVGTKMGVSGDAPWFDIAYKLVEYDGRPVLKLSTGKVSMPGRKQVFRIQDHRGFLARDHLALREEVIPGGKPLLEKFMDGGNPVGAYPGLKDIRERFADEFSRLKEPHKSIRNPRIYPVEVSPKLKLLAQEIERRLAESELGPTDIPARELGES